jgi:hypothetical protein
MKREREGKEKKMSVDIAATEPLGLNLAGSRQIAS